MKTLLIFIIAMNFLCYMIKIGNKSTALITLISLCLIIYNSQQYSDIINYRHYFYEVMDQTHSMREPGFFWITKLIQLFTYDFDVYRSIVFALTLLICLIVCFSYGKNASLFLMVYCAYFFYMDGIQIRNFLATSVLVYSVYSILKDEKNGIFKFIIGILIATTIHSSFIIYIILLLIKLDYKRITNKFRRNRIIILFSILITLSLSCVMRYSNVINVVLISFGSKFSSINERVSIYSSTTSRLGWIMPAASYLASFFSIIYASNVLKGSSENVYRRGMALFDSKLYFYDIPSFDVSSIDRLLLINAVGLLFVPLCLLNLTFYRLSKNIIFINSIIISNVLSLTGNNSKGRTTIVFISFILSIVVMAIFDLTIYNDLSMFENIYFSS